MSWTLFVVADPSDAEARVIAKPEDPRWSWTWIEQNTATLSVLGAVLHDADPDDVAFLEWNPLAQQSDEGPWVFQLPERLVSRLMAAEAVRVARAWSGVSLMSNYDEADLLSFLTDLRQLLESHEGRVLYWEMA